MLNQNLMDEEIAQCKVYCVVSVYVCVFECTKFFLLFMQSVTYISIIYFYILVVIYP